MKHAALVAVVATLACAPTAFARDAGSGELPAFASIPEGQVGVVPSVKKRPARIAAGEKVPGFYLVRNSKTRNRYSYLVGDEREADALVSRKRSKKTGAAVAPTACFTDGERLRGMRAMQTPGAVKGQVDEVPEEWTGGGNGRLMLLAPDGESRKGRPDTNGVHAVHAERFDAGEGDHASLEMTDAWVDATTLGVRLIGRSTLPLVHLASGPSGIELYAAREKDRVLVVVTPAKAPVASDAMGGIVTFNGADENLMASLTQNRSASSSCGHLRFSLRLEKGTADMARVQATALLPALEKDAEPGPEGETEAEKTARIQQARRRRPLNISVSASELSADPQPVLSVAMGWGGKEERSF